VITLRAALPRLFLQTPKDPVIWDVDGIGFELRLAFDSRRIERVAARNRLTGKRCRKLTEYD
jgi:hypothetical protein